MAGRILLHLWNAKAQKQALNTTLPSDGRRVTITISTVLYTRPVSKLAELEARLALRCQQCMFKMCAATPSPLNAVHPSLGPS